MPNRLIRPGKVVLRDEDKARVARQMREAAYGRQGLFLKTDEVQPNPRNPRKAFDERAINELAANILELGQLQPIIVRRTDEGYQIVVGERRWRAVRRAGLEEVWAVEKNVSDLDAYRMAVSENVQRVDLSHAEKVAALDELAELVQETGLRATARAIGTSHPWLLARLQMRQDPVIFPALEAGQISFMMADQLRRAPAHARRTLLDQVIRERPDPTSVRGWVREIKERERSARSQIAADIAGAPAPSTDPFDQVLALFLALGEPQNDYQRSAVRQIVELGHRLLGEPTGHQEGITDRGA